MASKKIDKDKTEITPIISDDKQEMPPSPKLTPQGGGVIGIEMSDEKLPKILGTTRKDTFALLLGQLTNVLGSNDNSENTAKKVAAMLPVLEAVSPRDELEAMLAIQMAGVHDLAMQRMNVGKKNTTQAMNSRVNQITKLTRTFIAQLEALNRHRGKGQQKMTVEHIHVSDGGQAVIGNVGKGGGGSGK